MATESTEEHGKIKALKAPPLPSGEGQGEGIKRVITLFKPPLPNPPPVGEGVCKAFIFPCSSVDSVANKIYLYQAEAVSEACRMQVTVTDIPKTALAVTAGYRKYWLQACNMI
jgi:hypothetical protein